MVVGVFDRLKKNTLKVNELAKVMNLHFGLLNTLIKVLKHAQFIEETKEGIYKLTEDSLIYFTDEYAKNQISGLQKFVAKDSPFSNLTSLLKSGPPAYMPNRWSTKKGMFAIEQDAKAGSIEAVQNFIISHAEFKTVTNICDYGGNSGYYTRDLIQTNPNVNIDVYDRPEVCEIAQDLNNVSSIYKGKINHIAYDITTVKKITKNYDLFFCSHILYHYMGLNGVEDSLESIIKKIYDTLNPGGLFISNHCGEKLSEEDALTNQIMELNVKMSGFPTHIISERSLISILEKNGFKILKMIPAAEGVHYGTMLLSAIKL
tara:strand:+ start:267 stop:1217 length:951 start_codon:yes stop_codon:yes gene_type:complete